MLNTNTGNIPDFIRKNYQGEGKSKWRSTLSGYQSLRRTQQLGLRVPDVDLVKLTELRQGGREGGRERESESESERETERERESESERDRDRERDWTPVSRPARLLTSYDERDPTKLKLYSF